MAAIKSKNTKPELIVRKGLHARGLRYRLHRKSLPGTPDLVLPSRRVVVFVNGCFWHAHEGCRHFKLPKTDQSRWKAKLEGNRQRDADNQRALKSLGWRVIVVWECSLRGKSADEVSQFLDELAQTVLFG